MDRGLSVDIFIYTNSLKNPSGKIRLIYEALPFAYMFSLIGGYGLDGSFNNLLNKVSTIDLRNKIHTRTEIILCSRKEYDNLNVLLNCFEDKN